MRPLRILEPVEKNAQNAKLDERFRSAAGLRPVGTSAVRLPTIEPRSDVVIHS
jgi:hypothetical protein